MAVAEPLVVDEDAVEQLVVARRQAEDGVLEERKRGHVRDAEVAEEEVAAG